MEHILLTAILNTAERSYTKHKPTQSRTAWISFPGIISVFSEAQIQSKSPYGRSSEANGPYRKHEHGACPALVGHQLSQTGTGSLKTGQFLPWEGEN